MSTIVKLGCLSVLGVLGLSLAASIFWSCLPMVIYVGSYIPTGLSIATHSSLLPVMTSSAIRFFCCHCRHCHHRFTSSLYCVPVCSAYQYTSIWLFMLFPPAYQYALVGNSMKVTFSNSVLVCVSTAYQYAVHTGMPAYHCSCYFLQCTSMLESGIYKDYNLASDKIDFFHILHFFVWFPRGVCVLIPILSVFHCTSTVFVLILKLCICTPPAPWLLYHMHHLSINTCKNHK